MKAAHPRARLWLGAAIFLLALQAAVLCWRMDRPWTYNDDYNGAFWSQAAHNLLRAGFTATAGLPAPLYFGAPPIPRDALYVHHPALLPALVAADRALLGPSEAAARALPILFSLLTSLLLWFLVRASAGPRQAAFTLALFVAAPMELHYGSMVNFEAPELCFLLAGLACLETWRRRPSWRSATGFLLCLVLAMWIDWLGYLLALLLAAPMFLTRAPSPPDRRLAAALLALSILSGLGFLLQIHLADPGAWKDLLRALHERAGHSDLSGGAFTFRDWLRVQWDNLTSLYHPLAWLLAIAGACCAWRDRPSARAPLRVAGLLFVMDAIYLTALRNQSFVHDFAGFYFLPPVAICGGYFLERIRRAPYSARPVSFIALLLLAALLFSGIRRLRDIDTPFRILDADKDEPPLLMPHLGRFLAGAFPPDAPILSNFDPYYSPLPYYARRPIENNLAAPAEWEAARADGPAAGGVIWLGAPGAAALLAHFPPAQLKPALIDGVRFACWTAPPAPPSP